MESVKSDRPNSSKPAAKNVVVKQERVSKENVVQDKPSEKVADVHMKAENIKLEEEVPKAFEPKKVEKVEMKFGSILEFDMMV